MEGLKPRTWGTGGHSLLALLAVAYATVALVLAAAMVGSVLLDHPIIEFLDEPAQDFSDAWYSGFVSTIGGLVWWSGATVCFVTAWVVRRFDRHLSWFWVASGALTAALAFDDLFLLHEIPIKRHLHLEEWMSFVVFGLTAATIGAVFRRHLRAMYWPLGLVALAFFATSVGLDQTAPTSGEHGWHALVEDGAKLFGIMSWTLFLFVSSRPHLMPSRRPNP